MLAQLGKRYSLMEVLKYLIENSDLVNLDFPTLYEIVKEFLEARGYNILSKTVLENKIQLFVQTNEGLEELIIDEELFASPYFSEATYIYNKLVERDLTVFEGRDLLDILDDIDYDTQEIQTILSRNLPSETYETLKKYLDDNSYLKTIWSYYDDEWDKKWRRKNIFMESN